MEQEVRLIFVLNLPPHPKAKRTDKSFTSVFWFTSHLWKGNIYLIPPEIETSTFLLIIVWHVHKFFFLCFWWIVFVYVCYFQEGVMTPSRKGGKLMSNTQAWLYSFLVYTYLIYYCSFKTCIAIWRVVVDKPKNFKHMATYHIAYNFSSFNKNMQARSGHKVLQIYFIIYIDA